MSLINIQGGDILVKSVEIYGSGIVQTTAQTGGVAPPITTGGFQTYSNVVAGSPAVNPAFIASQNVFGGGGLAYIVSMSFGIEATGGLAIPQTTSAVSLNISSSTVGLEQLNVGIQTTQDIVTSGTPDATIPYKWGDTITFLYYPDGGLGVLNTIEFGLTAIGYDPAETFECVYNFNWLQLAN
jgi:hypothetical protein